MIKPKNGIVTIGGEKSDMYADLGVIILTLVTEGIMTLDDVHRLADRVITIGAEADSCEE